MDVSDTLEMTICVVNQLKNDNYCYGLYYNDELQNQVTPKVARVVK